MSVLSSVNVIILLELSILLIVVLLFLFFRFNKAKSVAQNAANELVDKLEETRNIRDKQLARLISDHCAVDEQYAQETMQAIKTNEQLLYQKIIELYLLRDGEQLTNIDNYVANLAKPYHSLLASSALNASDGQLPLERIAEQERIQELEELVDRLSAQLTTAMDEVSAEYTRIFAGSRSEAELENSCKKMLATYQQALQEAKKLLLVSDLE
jgi:tRNA isopentenyl-2-thiomethyl-A-37 hydroxylase MiaE